MDTAMSTQEISSYGTSDVMRATGISLARLYYWERIGLLFPEVQRFGSRQYRRYGEEEVRKIRSLMRLLAEGYSLQGAARLTRQAQTNGRGTSPDGAGPDRPILQDINHGAKAAEAADEEHDVDES